MTLSAPRRAAQGTEGLPLKTDAEITAMAAKSRQARLIEEAYEARMRTKRRRGGEGSAEPVPAPPKPPLTPAGLSAARQAREQKGEG